MLHTFYPILPDANWIARLVPQGIKTVQLRIKNEPEETVRQMIRQSLTVCNNNQCQLIVNDYWREAIDLGADYIHLGQEDLAEADLSTIKRAGVKLGVSTHSREELEIALHAAPDYIALGPIYETKLKKMKWSPQGLEKITEWKKTISIPLVAIGGLTVESIEPVLAAGADSLAVVTDIVTNSAPEDRTKEWLEKVARTPAH